jgi:replicative DNA helicase
MAVVLREDSPPVNAPWYVDLVDPHDLPPLAELKAAAAALAALGAEWIKAVDERQSAPSSILTSREAIAEWLAEEQSEQKAALHTGWADLDKHLQRPVRAGELVLVAARAGVGKTWACQSWIESTLRADPLATAVIFEFEMLAWHLAERLASHALALSPSEARADAQAGKITVEAVLAAAPALDRLVIGDKGLTVEQLPKAIEEAAVQLGRRPTVVVVDYLGLLSWGGSPGARSYERASENAKRIKDVARSERVAIVAAAQMSRGAGDGSTEPTLDDLRDSGVVEEAADRVVAIWRPRNIEEIGKVKLDGRRVTDDVLGKVLKNRFGPTGGAFTLTYDHAMRLTKPPEEPEFPWDRIAEPPPAPAPATLA